MRLLVADIYTQVQDRGIGGPDALPGIGRAAGR